MLGIFNLIKLTVRLSQKDSYHSPLQLFAKYGLIYLC